MNRKLLVLLVFSLGLASVASAKPAQAMQHRSPTPAWLPRGALLGATFREGTITPRLKLQWQFTFFQDRKDAFTALAEGGLGWGAAMPTREAGRPETFLGSFYEHSLQVGVGYRNHLPDAVHWGFQVTGGPVFYGAHFDGGVAAPDRRVAGIIEGRIHLGYQFGTAATGLAVGWGEPFGTKRRSLSRIYLGGPMLGLFADWR